IYANPADIENPMRIAQILASRLGGTPYDYMPDLTADTTFVYIRHKVDMEVADLIEKELYDEDLTGVYFLEDTKRVYPYGATAGQILGVVGIDGDGLTGLEYYYDDILRGEDGQMIVEEGIGGVPIAGGASQIIEARNGTDIIISLDINLQEKAEAALADAVQTYESESGSIMVTNPRTGEIYCACSTPLANVDDLEHTSAEALNLKLVTDSYEPGSVFKALTLSIAFNNGLVTPSTVLTVPESVLVGDDYVFDDWTRTYAEQVTVREILPDSWNTGTAMIAQSIIGDELFAEGMDAFGIGHATGIDFPGESEGIVTPYSQYDGSTCGFMSFGQSVAIPMVQLVRAYGAIANHGVLTTPHFLIARGGEVIDWGQGERAISPEAADMAIDCMRAVMQNGTGVNGQVYGYDIAGKTGTGEQSVSGEGYTSAHFTASLCGFANADNPEVLVYAGLNGVSFLASASSAYIFSTIMEEAVNDINVQPVY
ncbi:MAG: penicillin-binding protein 2, partial [Coriobacteriaceae bacterium]|nr:penicillin-binding protein 2 [Coriobacteriaceae bacterium]